MQYNRQNVFTVVTADDIPQKTVAKGIFGYFANDIASLRQTVETDKTTARCLYGRLTYIKGSANRERFVLDKGNYMFSLFYPTDTFLNINRY